ncbi:MAG TPA: GAF domain-containing protein [Thermoanaerobaculia bacterium]|nr:GAF domain-containing protein [Thermoanaerobaculia bacterium]
MRSAPLPANESARLEALAGYEILDTPPEPEFDDLTLLASHICGAPQASISLVDRERQWFKSRVAVPANETPRDVAFCAHAILEDDVMIVPDAQADERFADNPLVTSGPGIRFYAGAPLINSEGHALGTLCVMDQVPRELAPDQVEGLRVLSRQVVAQLELRRRLRSEREQAGQKLLDREMTIEMIVGQMPAVLWSTDRDLRLTSSMGRALTAMGQRSGQSVGMTLSEYFDTDDPEFLPLAAHRKALMGESVDFEVEWSGRTFASYVEPLRNPDRSIKGVIGVALDITRRKRAESELKKSLTLLQATLDSAADGILVVSESGRILNFNQSFVELWNVPEEIAANRDGKTLLSFLLDQVRDPGSFAKKLMGLHSKRDTASLDGVELKDGRTLRRSSKPQKVDGRSVGTVWSFRESSGGARTSPA